MTTFTPGQSVRVHIGGVDNDPTGHEGEQTGRVTATDLVIVTLYGQQLNVSKSWVVPVTPPCPWTDNGTVIQTTTRPRHDILAFLSQQGEWIDAVAPEFPLDYATDIAPYKPRRLVPEPIKLPDLRDRDGDLWEHDGHRLDGTPIYRFEVARGTLAEIREKCGPVTEVTSARADTTPVTGIHILHLTPTGSEKFTASCHCGCWSPRVLVTQGEARIAHDLHLANVGQVSS